MGKGKRRGKDRQAMAADGLIVLCDRKGRPTHALLPFGHLAGLVATADGGAPVDDAEELGRRLAALAAAPLKLAAADEGGGKGQKDKAGQHEAGLASGLPAEIRGRLKRGENPIKVLRDHAGMTQQALAEHLGVTHGYVSQLENGRRVGSAKMLRRCAERLGVSVADLMGG